jgi:hypothetical protein
MRCNIISDFSNGPELYRFQGYSPTKWDYSLADDGNVTHYPDPPGGYWRKTDAPRFGLSCFAPTAPTKPSELPEVTARPSTRRFLKADAY